MVNSSRSGMQLGLHRPRRRWGRRSTPSVTSFRRSAMPGRSMAIESGIYLWFWALGRCFLTGSVDFGFIMHIYICLCVHIQGVCLKWSKTYSYIDTNRVIIKPTSTCDGVYQRGLALSIGWPPAHFPELVQGNMRRKLQNLANVPSDFLPDW